MKVKNLIMPLIFCLYLAGVALLCFLHEEDLPRISDTIFGMPADKAAHLIMFLPFLPLSYFAFRRKKDSKFVKLIILTGLLTMGAGTAYLTEAIQERLGYRSFDTKDLKMDYFALVVSYVLIAIGILMKKSRKRR